MWCVAQALPDVPHCFNPFTAGLVCCTCSIRCSVCLFHDSEADNCLKTFCWMLVPTPQWFENPCLNGFRCFVRWVVHTVLKECSVSYLWGSRYWNNYWTPGVMKVETNSCDIAVVNVNDLYVTVGWFTKLWKVIIGFVMSCHLHGVTLHVLGGFFLNFVLGRRDTKTIKNFKKFLKLGKNSCFT